MNPDKTGITEADEQSFDTDREAENWITISLREMRNKNKENKRRGYFCPAYILVERDNGREKKDKYVTL